MLFRIAIFLGFVGVIIMMAGMPISAYINEAEIWTEAGQLAMNKCMAIGSSIALFGCLLILIDILFTKK